MNQTKKYPFYLPSFQFGGNPPMNTNLNQSLNNLDPLGTNVNVNNIVDFQKLLKEDNHQRGLFANQRYNQVERVNQQMNPTGFNVPDFNFSPNVVEDDMSYNGIGRDPNFVSGLSEDSITAGEDFRNQNPLPEGVFDDSLNFDTDTNYAGMMGNPSSSNPQANKRFIDKSSYFNPYGGINLESALFTLGQSFRSEGSPGNTLRGIGAAGKVLLNSGRLVGAGMGIANREAQVNQYYREQQRRALANANQYGNGGLFQYFRNGGTVNELTPEQILTGEFITGLPDHALEKANAEIEKDEYVKHPNGDVQKVVGKTHEQGGEKVNLETGTLIISDNLEIDGDLSKEIKDKYDLKVNSGDTFARVIEKFTNKLGITKLNDEQETYFKKLKKQEDIKDESTSNLNNEFLSGKIKEIEDKKKLLETQRASFVDFIFNKQEAQKGEEIPVFREGGIIKDRKLQSLMAKYNIDENTALDLISSYKKGGKKESDNYYEDGGGDLLEILKNSYNSQKLSPRERQRFTLALNNSQDPYISGNLGSPEQIMQRIKEEARVNPELIKQNFGLIIDAQGELTSLDPNAKPLSRFDPSTVGNFQKEYSDKITKTIKYIENSNEFSADEKKQYIDALKQETFVEGDTQTARGFDSIFGNFTSSRPGLKFNVIDEKDFDKVKNLTLKDLYDDKGNIKPELGLNDNTIKNLGRLSGFEANALLGQVKEGKPTEEVVTPEKVNTIDPNANLRDFNLPEVRNRLKIAMLPDQSALPPDAVQPHTKISRRYERLDPVKIGVEENLKEIFRQEDFTVDQLNNLPDSQRRVALANLTASSQENINKAITSTNIANAQNFQQTEQFNIGQSTREEDARATDMLSFEQRQLTALGKTQADIANYFDFNRKVQLGNYNTVNRLSILDDIYENYNFNPNGGIEFDSSTSAPLYVPDTVSRIKEDIKNKKK